MGHLHLAVRRNDLSEVQSIISSSQSPKSLVNEVDEDGGSPLYYAVKGPTDIQITKLLLESGANVDFQVEDKYHGERLIWKALKNSSLEVIQLLASFGADYLFVDENGYDAVLTVVYSKTERLTVLHYLLSLGAQVNAKSNYGETGLKSAYRLGYLEIVRELIKAGADLAQLKWTPLIQSVVLGSPSEVVDELRSAKNIHSRDCLGRTAFHAAIRRGSMEMAQILLEAGANISEPSDNDTQPLCLAVESGNVELVRWLVQQGCSVESKNFLGETCLSIALQRENHPMVKTLLDLGANPSAGEKYGKPMDKAQDRESIFILAEHGANLDELSGAGRTALFQTPGCEDALHRVTEDQYLKYRGPREGVANPELATNPFWSAMIECGFGAYGARRHFKDESGYGDDRAPIWCFSRFGQSTTLLPDGRMIFIAGEHEDFYDPDFCIYNDVVVLEPDGTHNIYIYPTSVFPPTDFHSATLVDNWIYIIGSLGYQGTRMGDTPVYRLDTKTLKIEAVPTTGESPGWISQHTAKLNGQNKIEVRGGKSEVKKRFRQAKLIENHDVFELDLKSLTWARRASES